MKLVILSNLHPAYLRKFYEDRPSLQNLTFSEQKEALDYDAFGWANFWSTALQAHGYEVLELTPNAEPMQRAWAAENVVFRRLSTITLRKIVVEQVRKFEPEILWFNDYDADLLDEIRAAVPSIRLVLGAVGSAVPDTDIWRNIDVVISCAPESIERLRMAGVGVELLSHAFAPDINNRLKNASWEVEFSFVGQIVRGCQYHLFREQLLERLVLETGLEVRSPSADYALRDELRALVMAGSYMWVRTLSAFGVPDSLLTSLPLVRRIARWQTKPTCPVSRVLKSHIKPAVFGLEMYQYLRNSKVNLNIHADSSPLFASNMRLFEATGVGVCLLTDWKRNLSEFFVPDEEVVTYRSIEECIDKTRWLLDHPEERERIARAGQRRALSEHTYAQRALVLDRIIKRRMV